MVVEEKVAVRLADDVVAAKLWKPEHISEGVFPLMNAQSRYDQGQRYAVVRFYDSTLEYGNWVEEAVTLEEFSANPDRYGRNDTGLIDIQAYLDFRAGVPWVREGEAVGGTVLDKREYVLGPDWRETRVVVSGEAPAILGHDATRALLWAYNDDESWFFVNYRAGYHAFKGPFEILEPGRCTFGGLTIEATRAY